MQRKLIAQDKLASLGAIVESFGHDGTVEELQGWLDGLASGSPDRRALVLSGRHAAKLAALIESPDLEVGELGEAAAWASATALPGGLELEVFNGAAPISGAGILADWLALLDAIRAGAPGWRVIHSPGAVDLPDDLAAHVLVIELAGAEELAEV